MLLPIVCIVSAIHKEYAACDQFSFVNFLENKATCKVDLCFCVDCCGKHFWSGQPDVIPGKWLGEVTRKVGVTSHLGSAENHIKLPLGSWHCKSSKLSIPGKKGLRVSQSELFLLSVPAMPIA